MAISGILKQVQNESHSKIMRGAWNYGQQVAVHGWIYGRENGLIRDLQVTMTADTDPSQIYQQAPAQLELARRYFAFILRFKRMFPDLWD